MNLLAMALGALAALGCLLGAFRSLRRKRLIDDTPTSKTQGVFIGLAELKGTAESEAPLTSYLAAARCVLYDWQVQEHWSRTVTETYTDAKGHTQTRTRTESGWKTVADGGESAPFYLMDDTGVIRIMPEGADIHGVTTFDETCSRDNPLYFSKAPAGEVAHSTHRRRFRETAIPLHATLYVMGQARERRDAVAAEIAADKNAPLYVISTRTEKQLSTGYNTTHWLWLSLGLVAILGAIAISQWLQPFLPAWQWPPFIIAAAGYLLALALGWLWTVYNSLVNLHHRVEQAWSQVDVQLKRRYDLIPNLAQAVAGYRAYEAELQKLTAEWRGQATGQRSGIKGLTPGLRGVLERYPELKASELFLKLQQALAETEQRIALARDYFNAVATFYNTRLEVIPDRYVGILGGLHQEPLLAAAGLERAEVKVKLAD